MRLYRIAGSDIAEEDPGRVSAVLADDDAILWLDLSAGDEQMQDVLTQAFGVRSSALRECEQPGLVPRVRLYTGHVFVELHAPATGADGWSTRWRWCCSSVAATS